MQRARISLLPDLTRSFPVKFGLVVNPIPRNVFPINSFWYIKLLFHELGPACFVELKALIAAVIYAENRVAYCNIERSIEVACFTASLGRIKTTSIEYVDE